MDRKSKTLIWSLVAVFILAGVWNYYTLVSRHDFTIFAHIACDSTKNSCFTTACDSSSGEDCTNKNYAKIEKRATNISLCNKFADSCPELSCATNEAGCVITFCDSDSAEDGEACVGPTASSSDASTTVATTMDSTATSTDPQNP